MNAMRCANFNRCGGQCQQNSFSNHSAESTKTMLRLLTNKHDIDQFKDAYGDSNSGKFESEIRKHSSITSSGFQQF